MDIGVLGCGVMGSAFAAHFSRAHSLYLYTRNHEKLQTLTKQLNAKAMGSAQELAAKVDVLLLAVKPHHLHEVAKEIEASIKEETLVISILGGTTLEMLQERFSRGKIIRAMPNLPIQCGKGIVAITESLPVERTMVEELLADFGQTLFVPEELFDAIGVLAGSGPAYIFLVIEALIEAGIAMGISSSDAMNYALHMIEGSTALLRERGEVPEKLKWEVTSPGGTTIAGLAQMEKSGVKSGLIQGMLASFEKSHSIH